MQTGHIMSLQQEEAVERPPPPYNQTTSGATEFPPVPTHHPSSPPRSSPYSAPAKSLPSLLPGVQNASQDANVFASRDQKIVLPPMQLPKVPSHVPERNIPTDGDTTMSVDDPDQGRRDASVSMDDPDDRMAAEALCGLGKTETATTTSSSTRSPTGYETPLKYYPIGIEHTSSSSHNQDSEPLLSLLTSSHPWLGGTLGGSISAYSSTKSYSPRFIQYGADIVENTVGTVGRRTGVEEGIRRYLGGRQAGGFDDLTHGKIKLHNDVNSMDIEQGGQLRLQRRKESGTSSVDSLPAYDNNRSPAYEEGGDRQPTTSPQTTSSLARRPTIPRSWSTQLMISTSGLGVALNEASLRSLKFCLSILSGANRHVRSLMDALKQLLSDWDNRSSSHNNRLESGTATANDGDDDVAMTDVSTDGATARSANDEANAIADRIRALNAEIWSTLKNVVNSVSRYTGGALPENASAVVRWQLMSVPRRWHRAVTSTRTASGSGPAGSSGGSAAQQQQGGQDDDAVGAANRMLAFAIEGLDMMEQVGGVVDSTITSAERWLDSMGRRRKENGERPSGSGGEDDGAAGSAGEGSRVGIEGEKAEMGS